MNKKILVIEDDPGSLRLIRYTLEREGYQVLTATDGLEGLRKAQNKEPDLIVSDLMLPGIDGFEICRCLRAEPQTAELPIFILSAVVSEIDNETKLKVGADDYISKPWHRLELATKIATMLERKSAVLSSKL